MNNQKLKPPKRVNLEEEIRNFNQQNNEKGILAQMKFPKGTVLIMITPQEITSNMNKTPTKPTS